MNNSGVLTQRFLLDSKNAELVTQIAKLLQLSIGTVYLWLDKVWLPLQSITIDVMEHTRSYLINLVKLAQDRRLKFILNTTISSCINIR
jgi:archaellum component FlaF (FlaF/FlaG flagellin family)